MSGGVMRSCTEKLYRPQWQMMMIQLLLLLSLQDSTGRQPCWGTGLPGQGEDKQESVALVLSQLVSSLQWPRVLIVFQQHTGWLYDTLVMRLSELGVKVVGLTFDWALTSKDLEALVPRGSSARSHSLYVLALTSGQSAQQLLRKASEMERKFGMETCIRECSEWLLTLLPGNDSSEDDLPWNDVTLNNVAMVTTDTQEKNVQVRTLTVTPQGRSLVPVAYVTTDSQTETRDKVFPNLRYKLNGRKFRIATRGRYSTFSGCQAEQDDAVCLLGAHLLEYLTNHLNFTYELCPVSDGEHGAEDSDGKWTGMIGALQRLEADVALGELTPSVSREKVADFTTHFDVSFVTFCYRRPSGESNRWRLYLRPFTWPVLACLGGVAIGVTCLLHMICVLSPAPAQGKRLRLLDLRHLLRCLGKVLGAAIGIGSDRLPEMTSARVLLGSWWLTSVIVMATYTGNLLAFLADNRPSLTFRTLEDLLSQHEYTMGVPRGTLLFNTLSNASSQTQRELWYRMEELNKSDPTIFDVLTPNLFKKMQNEKFVLFVASRYAYEVANKEGFEVECSKENLAPDEASLALTNNSAYTDYFSEAIQRLVESGLYSEWKKRLSPTAAEDSNSRIPVVGLPDAQCAFYCLLIGAAVSCVILLAEWLHNRRK